MIQDGYLTHGDFANPLVYWDMPTTLSSAFFVAIQTTLLSYQATALFFDLLLGFKRRSYTNAADLQTFLLTEGSSLKNLLAAIFRLDFLDRARFRRDIPVNSTIVRPEKSIRFQVIVKVCVLFLLAPVMNILSVVLLTLEHKTSITFGEAQFGGVAVGVNTDLSTVRMNPSASPCSPLLFSSPLDVDPRFVCELCTSSTPYRPAREGEAKYSIQLTSRPNGQVSIRQVISGVEAFTDVLVDCNIEDWTYRVKPVIGPDAARAFVEHATVVIQKSCIEEGTSAPTIGYGDSFLVEEDRGITVQQVVGCTKTALLPEEVRREILREIAQVVTMINTENFEISGNVTSDGENYSSFTVRDDLVMMTKVRRNASPIVLSIVVIAVLIARMVVKLFTNNDVDEGVEAIVKSFFGLPTLGSSLLAEEKVVKFNFKHQRGKKAHYGVESSFLPEVEEFNEGIIG